MKIFDVIKYEGSNDILAWKYPGEDFNTLSQLIVHESQEAVFFKDGQALDLFEAGRYTLHSQNIPLIRRAINLPFNGESPFHCEVYFINRVITMDVMWGTSSPIPIQDAKYQIVLPIRANGQFAVKIIDSKNFLRNLVGTTYQFDQTTLKKYFKGILLTNIKDYIATQFVQKNVSFLEIHSKLKEISIGIQKCLEEEFLKYGIQLVNFNVNEIVPPEDDSSYVQLKKALAKKAEMSVMGYNYQQERAFNVLDTAAANEGNAGEVMGVGMGFGMGANLGAVIGSTMGNAMGNITPDKKVQLEEENEEGKKIICSECHKEIPADAKFCLNCGKKVEIQIPAGMKKCQKCGNIVPEGNFCLECGSKLEELCSNCGAKIVSGAKFCLECGKKVKE